MWVIENFQYQRARLIDATAVTTSEDVLQAAASKEIAWLQRYGTPRLPFDRVYRDITDYRKSDPQEHLQNLHRYLQVTRQLVPEDKMLHRPTLRHADLNPNNIFISEDFQIRGIIDWQHSTVLPLFLHAGIPAHFQNYGDPVSENLEEPRLPHDLDEMDDDDREKELELYRRRHLHFYYLGATAKNNGSHFQALMDQGGLLRRKLFQHAGEPWEGNNIPLKADLIRMTQHWSELVPQGIDGSPCPIRFDNGEIGETLQGMAKQEEADSQIEILRNALGISVDGWVSHEGYQDAVAQAAEMKLQAIEYAESDLEREMTVKHWPFGDYDEKE